ncbi:type I-E CRISPR-associated protein Cse2/CasB [Kitasatospora sp. NPDC049258]|uniref:type I-E CRISPR-associated protein Cse2/CasB n=1 Tax=Kitasatospora sp. NPDC049258 TaxID=3155394 RepID=UPI00342F3429
MSDVSTAVVPAPREEPAKDVQALADERDLSGAGNRSAAERHKARAFIRWVDRLSFEDPGARSALRRGRGKDLDAVPFMHRFVAGWLTEEQLRDPDVERAYYTMASLIASQRREQYAAAKGIADGDGAAPPVGGRHGRSLGVAFADAVAKGDAGLRESSAQTRLNLLARQSVDGLHRHLPGAVRQLRDRQVEVDWAQLLVDLSCWRRHAGAVKRRWLQDYYRARLASEYKAALEADQELAALQAAGDEQSDTPATES